MPSGVKLLPAAIADTVKLNAMVMNGKGGGLIDPVVQRIIDRQLQIGDRTATLADEVVVGFGVGIETIEGTAEIDLLCQPLFDQDTEVSIYGAHAQIGKLPLQPFVNPIGRGVPPRTLQQFENSLPLSASLVLASVFDESAPK